MLLLTLALAAPASAEPIGLGLGRAAVLDVPGPVSDLMVSSASVVQVTDRSPWLVVAGTRPGEAQVRFRSGGAEHRYEITVHADPSTPTTGARPGAELSLSPGEGALCTFDAPHGSVVLDERVAEVEPFLKRSYLLKAVKEGVVDVVFEGHARPPVVVTVRAKRGATGGRTPQCQTPTETLHLSAGGAMQVDVGTTIEAVLVGNTRALEALPVEGRADEIWLQSHSRGTTVLAVHTGDDAKVWMRRVVMQ